MNKFVGILLIVAGIALLFYGAGTFETGPSVAQMTPFEETPEDSQERVVAPRSNLPVWGGLLAVAAGAALLFVHVRSRRAGV